MEHASDRTSSSSTAVTTVASRQTARPLYRNVGEMFAAENATARRQGRTPPRYGDALTVACDRSRAPTRNEAFENEVMALVLAVDRAAVDPLAAAALVRHTYQVADPERQGRVEEWRALTPGEDVANHQSEHPSDEADLPPATGS
jgi:hypothetical protein